ncbi:MAG TPA: DUF3817 domain-containing protein [Glaciihabitans sp.]|jgi:integral membrane protein|nr:DUF3817 domain-containing protein [Glaciihabitans sp.]
MAPRHLFRTFAIAEAITWTFLIAGMLQKYVFEAGEWGVSIGGFLHGLIFIAYGMTVLLVGVNQRWSAGLMVTAVATAVIPYATIPFEMWATRTGKLQGAWLREPTGDRHDNAWYARLLRWMLAHPIILTVVFVVALATIMTVLLVLGPPGGGN